MSTLTEKEKIKYERIFGKRWSIELANFLKSKLLCSNNFLNISNNLFLE